MSPAAPQKKKQTFVVQAKEIVEMLNEAHKTLGLMAQQSRGLVILAEDQGSVPSALLWPPWVT